MTVKIHVKVKFRAFGVTFGTVDQTVPWVIPVAFPISGGKIVLMNDRGILIEVSLAELGA